ncbi:MAG: hypothetical protein H0U23_16590 [Blastocatellia bacterium]|nr:hypothetical protein [Blastocatellia bacterium]
MLDYTVHLGTPTKLADLEFDRQEYYRDTGGDVVGITSYISTKKGLTITTENRDGEEYVGRLIFRPSLNDAKEFACGK